MAVKAALTKQGTPYVWGAKGPKVFDCSGLTQWAWGQAGVTIGPDTYTQVKQGVPVAPGDVQAGDLIFPKVLVGFTRDRATSSWRSHRPRSCTRRRPAMWCGLRPCRRISSPAGPSQRDAWSR